MLWGRAWIDHLTQNEISKGRHSDEQTVAPLLFLCEKGLEPPKMALAVPFE